MKFSVITVVKNEEKYIGRLIDSILSQDEDVEILAIDNCSEDNTLNIIGSYVNPRIKIYPRFQGQIHQLFAMGIRDALGDVILFLGGDDFYMPNAFKKIKEIIGNSWVIGKVVREDGLITKLDNPEIMDSRGMAFSKEFLEKNNLHLEWEEYPNICDYVLRKKAWLIEAPRIITDVLAFANLSKYTLHNKKERNLELKKFRQS